MALGNAGYNVALGPQAAVPYYPPGVVNPLVRPQQLIVNGLPGGQLALPPGQLGLPAAPNANPTTLAVQQAQRLALPPGQQAMAMGPGQGLPNITPPLQTNGGLGGAAGAQNINVNYGPMNPYAANPPPPSSPLPPPPNAAVAGEAAAVESAAAKSLGSRIAGGVGGGLKGLAVPAAALAAQGYVNQNVEPGQSRDLVNTGIGGLGTGATLAGFLPNATLPAALGGGTSAAFVPAAAVAGGVTLGQALTQPGTDYNVADILRKATYQKENAGIGPNGVFLSPTASQVTAQEGGSFGDRVKAAIADTSILPDIKQGLDLLTGNKTDAGSADSTFDLLGKVPLVGSLFGGGSSTAEAAPSAKDATVANTDLNSRWAELNKAVLSDNETSSKQLQADMDSLKKTYNVLRATGASDEEAWAAVQQGAVQAAQNEASNKSTLAKLDEQRQSIKSYMQPYIDRQEILGRLQGQALAGLGGTVGAAYQPVINYLSQTAPVAAASTGNQLMQQALQVPTQQQQKQEQALQAQFQNQINQYLLGQQLKQQKGSLGNSPQAQQLSQTLAATGQ